MVADHIIVYWHRFLYWTCQNLYYRYEIGALFCKLVDTVVQDNIAMKVKWNQMEILTKSFVLP